MAQPDHPYVAVDRLSRHYDPPSSGSRLEHLFARFGGIEPGEALLDDDEDDDVLEQDVDDVEGERADRHIVALDGVSFHADGGSCVAFIGPPAAGKSVLLKVIAGL